MKWIAGSLVLLALLAGGARAQLADLDARRAAARAGLQQDVEAYVEWCQKNSLFNERRKAYELLLELDPQHPEALKTLGYTREKSGEWKPPASPKTFRDFDKKALEEAPERWQAATAGFVAAMLALLESGQLAPLQRDEVAREALRFDPEHARIHALLGEVRGEKGWVLPETVQAKARRELLRQHVRSALESTPSAAPVPLLARERGIPLALQAVAAPGLRVVGTADADELRLCAHAVLALQTMLQLVFDSKYALPADCTVFLLSDPQHKGPFLAHHPGISGAQRAFYEPLEGAGIAGTNDFAFWTGDTQRRIDGIVRLALGFWLSGAFEITVDQGWVYEGFGLFLTRSLVRTRMTWLAQPSLVLDAAADMALRQKLLDPGSNWMDEALTMLREKRQPPLSELVKKSASQLTTEDVLYAYALATYLLEARPAGLVPMLTRLGRGSARAQTLQEALGSDFATFEAHLLRWLSERT